jgi:hypothetical protein
VVENSGKLWLWKGEERLLVEEEEKVREARRKKNLRR